MALLNILLTPVAGHAIFVQAIHNLRATIISRVFAVFVSDLFSHAAQLTSLFGGCNAFGANTYLQDDLGCFNSLSARLTCNQKSGKNNARQKIITYASERKINHFELIPVVFSVPSSPLADQTPSRRVLALDAEAVQEF